MTECVINCSLCKTPFAHNSLGEIMCSDCYVLEQKLKVLKSKNKNIAKKYLLQFIEYI